MKNKILSKGFLVPIVIILLLLNAIMFVIDKAVPDDEVKPNMIIVSKTANNQTYLDFQDTVLKLDPKIFNKMTFRFIDPTKNDYQKFVDTYKITTTFEIIITNHKGNVVERWSNSKTQEDLIKAIKKLT